ncbi:MAG: phosphate acyltransferase PlsX [Chloroflexota bacterium]|jgi:glycerol-3-phosphate acyltransferase PlsX|nr:phosphate acyltransferase PlsX [Chloroflexota bacterium]
MPTKLVIAVDAMGGDHGPEVVVSGAVSGARRFGVSLLLHGDESLIGATLERLDTQGVDIDVVDTSEIITMDDHPAQAVRRKPDSSLMRAIQAVKDGDASAMLSAGNSGAVMAGTLMSLGRIKGVDRPAIGSYMPALKGKTLVLDLGAVTDPKPVHLVQFALMGQTYARYVLNVPEPTIGLLSNGEEPGKGNQLTLAAHKLLASTHGIDFRGNVEGRDIALGVVDIVVTDGFTGNVALKTAEGTAALLTESLKELLTASPLRKLAALALRPAFQELRRRLDYAEIGGAPLLGIDGTAIIAHGRSNALAIENALGVAARSSEQRLPSRIAERIAQEPEARDADEHS